MSHFSDTLDVEHNLFVAGSAPGWFRVRYEKEILTDFMEIENQLEEIELRPLTLLSLCDAICVELRLRESILVSSKYSKKWAYISDTLRSCQWFHFFDIIEVVGELLAKKEETLVEEYRVLLNQYGEGYDYTDELDYWQDVGHMLSNYGFDVYLQKVNFLFISSWPKYVLGDDSKIRAIDDSEANTLREKIVNSAETEQQTNNSAMLIPKSDVDTVLDLISKSELVDEANRQSLRTGLQFSKEERYQEALRLIYPTIEAIINKCLKNEGRSPDEFSGWAQKVQWLESNGRLPPDYAKTLGIIQGRNYIIHGDYAPPIELLEPLCVLAIRYIKRLLTEYKHDLSKLP